MEEDYCSLLLLLLTLRAVLPCARQSRRCWAASWRRGWSVTRHRACCRVPTPSFVWRRCWFNCRPTWNRSTAVIVSFSRTQVTPPPFDCAAFAGSLSCDLIDWVEVLRPTRHGRGRFGDVWTDRMYTEETKQQDAWLACCTCQVTALCALLLIAHASECTYLYEFAFYLEEWHGCGDGGITAIVTRYSVLSTRE